MKYYMVKGKRTDKSNNDKTNTVNISNKAKEAQCEEQKQGKINKGSIRKNKLHSRTQGLIP